MKGVIVTPLNRKLRENPDKGKTSEISQQLAMKPRATKFCVYIVALSSGPSTRGVNYNPSVEMIAKGYKFYMGLYSEIF